MRWFDNWFMKQSKKAWNSRHNNVKMEYPELSSSSGGRVIPSQNINSPEFSVSGLTLTIYNADGGHVVEFKSYNANTDRYESSLSVIGNEEDFQERISGAITMELMKRGSR